LAAILDQSMSLRLAMAAEDDEEHAVAPLPIQIREVATPAMFR
jgi:hypothetical protein